MIFKNEYKVPARSDDDVTPEETLIDESSELSNLEQPISTAVFRSATIIAGIAAVVLAAGSFRISVLEHEELSALAFRNKTVNIALSPPRGSITDRQGKPLVKNVPSFDLLVVSRELPRSGEERTTEWKQLAKIIGRTEEEFEGTMKAEMEQNSIFYLASDLTKEQVLAITQRRAPGFHIVTTTKRAYIDGPQFAHVLGYTGKVSKKDLERDSYYVQSDTIGRLGIEAQFEDTLRGEHGRIFFARDGEDAIEKQPLSGDTVALNIDYDIQKALYREVFAVLRGTPTTGAAGIVQDPRSGAVLGMVSFPTFDNNVFNGPVSQVEYERLFENRTKPLFNRVINGLYNPGSTIKPLIGLAALQEDVIDENDVTHDCVELRVVNPFDPDDVRVFKNWRAEFGPFTLSRAIANSCNVYFFTVGGGFGNVAGLGIDRIVLYLKALLANVSLGIDLPGEERGFVPTPEWKLEKRGERWYQGDTYNVSIGQGDLLVTPLWINTYISAIANGGTVYRPRVANRIVGNGGEQTIFEPEQLAALPFSPEYIEAMKRAMRETVISGTGKALNDLPVPAAAKTGTAEVVKGRTVNSLFTVFAPVDDPEIALTILIEGSASNEGFAIRAAHQFLRWYFKAPEPSAVPTLSPGLSTSPPSTP